MLIEIKNVYGLVIYSSSKHDNIKDVVEEAVANKVSLNWANLEGVDLSEAQLRKASLRFANLKGANLKLVDLERSDMYDADLRGAYLRCVNLRCANLHGSNLRNTDLKMADLSEANLIYTNLMWANLEEANLTGVQLAGAHVDILLGINYAVCSFRGHGECGRQLLAVEINSEVMLFCGCFSGNEKELRDYIESGDENFKESRLLALETVLKLISIKKKY